MFCHFKVFSLAVMYCTCTFQRNLHFWRPWTLLHPYKKWKMNNSSCTETVESRFFWWLRNQLRWLFVFDKRSESFTMHVSLLVKHLASLCYLSLKFDVTPTVSNLYAYLSKAANVAACERDACSLNRFSVRIGHKNYKGIRVFHKYKTFFVSWHL